MGRATKAPRSWKRKKIRSPILLRRLCAMFLCFFRDRVGDRQGGRDSCRESGSDVLAVFQALLRRGLRYSRRRVPLESVVVVSLLATQQHIIFVPKEEEQLL